MCVCIHILYMYIFCIYFVMILAMVIYGTNIAFIYRPVCSYFGPFIRTGVVASFIIVAVPLRFFVRILNKQ